MATSVNIAGGDDQFNRYKMPPVLGKVEGRGNGIKTRIVNCYEVAKALHRPPGYVCKFFGCELGAQTKIDDNQAIYIVNGSFDNAVLSETLQNFIKMFVLCAQCKLPETDLKLKKNGDIKQECNACGAETMCDMSHKLCTYITNNPPNGKKKKSDGKGKGDKAQRRLRKAAKDKERANGEDDGEDSDEKQRRKAEKAAKKAAKKAAEAGDTFAMVGELDFSSPTLGVDPLTVGTNDAADDDDVQWSVDTSKEAEEERLRDMGAAVSILERKHNADDGSKALKLRAYIDDGKKPAKVASKSARIFGDEDVIRGIMMAALVDETPATIPSSVTARAVPALTHFGTPMDTSSQRALCNYFDWAAVNDSSVITVLPHILKALYDGQLLEEEVIFAWFRSAEGRSDVRDAVKVIIDWLENAEEESDEEESDE